MFFIIFNKRESIPSPCLKQMENRPVKIGRFSVGNYFILSLTVTVFTVLPYLSVTTQ